MARELFEMLPLELVFEDFNGVEKVASLGRSLSLRGVPDADAPRPGEIGYYAPSQSFVLYYTKATYQHHLPSMRTQAAHHSNSSSKKPEGHT